MNRTEILGTGNKNILVLTGVHGNEITPVYTGYLLKKFDFDKSKFKKLTILNAVNTDGIKNNIREIPNNQTSDLNRMFKVDFDNNISVDELTQLFNDNDVIIDVHSSPSCCEFILLNQDETTNSYVEFALKNDIKYLIRYSDTNTIKKYGLDKGKISFTIEINQMNYIDYYSAKRGLDLIINIINNCDDFKLTLCEPKYDEFFEFFTYKDGLFLPQVKLGQIISEGDWLGDLLDLTTFDTEKIFYRKDRKARIICSGESQYVSAGRSMFFLQPV